MNGRSVRRPPTCLIDSCSSIAQFSEKALLTFAGPDTVRNSYNVEPLLGRRPPIHGVAYNSTVNIFTGKRPPISSAVWPICDMDPHLLAGVSPDTTRSTFLI